MLRYLRQALLTLGTEELWLHLHAQLFHHRSCLLASLCSVRLSLGESRNEILLTRPIRTFQGGLVNGGPSTLVYGLILSFLGSLATAASLAEMASMFVAPRVVPAKIPFVHGN